MHKGTSRANSGQRRADPFVEGRCSNGTGWPEPGGRTPSSPRSVAQPPTRPSSTSPASVDFDLCSQAPRRTSTTTSRRSSSPGRLRDLPRHGPRRARIGDRATAVTACPIAGGGLCAGVERRVLASNACPLVQHAATRCGPLRGCACHDHPRSRCQPTPRASPPCGLDAGGHAHCPGCCFTGPIRPMRQRVGSMFAQPSEALGGSIGGGAFNGHAVSEAGADLALAKPLRSFNAGGTTSGCAPLCRPTSTTTSRRSTAKVSA